MSAYQDVANDGFAITPNDAADLTRSAISLYVGGDGSLKVTTRGGTVLTLANVKAGSIIPLRVARVWANGTTATGLVGLV